MSGFRPRRELKNRYFLEADFTALNLHIFESTIGLTLRMYEDYSRSLGLHKCMYEIRIYNSSVI